MDDKKIGMIIVGVIVLASLAVSYLNPDAITDKVSSIIQSALTGIFGAALGIAIGKKTKKEDPKNE